MYHTKTSRLQMPTIAFSAALVLALFAILSFALPNVTYVSPTLSDNVTTGANWVFVNVTENATSGWNLYKYEL